MVVCYIGDMTKTKGQIIEMIARLPLSERRQLVQLVQELGLLEERFYDSMTPEHWAHLDEGIAQADRAEGKPAPEVFDR